MRRNFDWCKSNDLGISKPSKNREPNFWDGRRNSSKTCWKMHRNIKLERLKYSRFNWAIWLRLTRVANHLQTTVTEWLPQIQQIAKMKIQKTMIKQPKRKLKKRKRLIWWENSTAIDTQAFCRLSSNKNPRNSKKSRRFKRRSKRKSKK